MKSYLAHWLAGMGLAYIDDRLRIAKLPRKPLLMIFPDDWVRMEGCASDRRVVRPGKQLLAIGFGGGTQVDFTVHERGSYALGADAIDEGASPVRNRLTLVDGIDKGTELADELLMGEVAGHAGVDRR